MKYIVVLLGLLIAPPIAAQPGKSPKAAAKSVASATADETYKEISWDELVPKNWNPAKRFRKFNLATLSDADPRAWEVLRIMKEEWDKAPIDPSLDGRKVKISGFVVPIEEKERAVTEFLLVPYFGACIHVPPPPANQIIHVISPKPIKRLRTMDAVWVTGVLKAARYARRTLMGTGASGYQINSTSVTPYKEPAMVTITPLR
jgi:uncharacterized protein